MGSTSSLSNINQHSIQSKFGVAEGLLRVLATKMPELEQSVSDEALYSHMNSIANRLHQADLYDFSDKDPQSVENLIRLMQFADKLLDLSRNRPKTNKILELIKEIQTSEEQYSDIIDVMILIAKRENENPK